VLGRRIPDGQALSIAALGCLLAIACGAAAGTGYGLPAAGTLLALGVVIGLVVLYLRDPVSALIGLWAFTLLDPAVTTMVGFSSSTGVMVRYSDEALVLLFAGLTVRQAARANVRLPSWYIACVGGVALAGLGSAALHHAPLSASVPGAWLGLKLLIMVGIAFVLPWKPGDLDRVYRVIVKIGALVAAYGFADFLAGGAISSALQTSAFNPPAGKARAESVVAIFPKPGAESLFMTVLFAIAFTRYAAKRSRADLAYSVAFAVAVVLTLRVKGFVSLGVVVVIVLIAQQWARERNALSLLLVGLLLVGSAYPVMASVIATHVSVYTSTTETTARSDLYATGKQIADDNFPLGVGFGRYASYPSRSEYSPVYDEYGLSSIWGLSRTAPQFINDTSWPTVMGETGYLGLGAYIFGLVCLVALLVRRWRRAPREHRWALLAALCILAVILTDSTASPALFNWVPATTFGLILGAALYAGGPANRPTLR
jgi:hypothetical protein